MKADDFSERPEEQFLAQEGYALMGAAFEVHREMGGGLLEEVYQESLEHELRLRSIPFIAKQELALHYKGRELKKRHVPDLFVHAHIVTELKSQSTLSVDGEAQLLNYMRLARKSVGYLINFGPIKKLEWRRLVLSEFIPFNRR
jgi:GxxExxY protein